MILKYKKIKLSLNFQKKFMIHIPFSYIFRSVIGKELKYLSCVLKQQICSECPLRFKCAYSVLFENPIDKENISLHGRDKAPSPYIIQADYIKNQEIHKVDISVIFTGIGMEYISYFILAAKRAGEIGMFKDRIPYNLDYISCLNNEYSEVFDFNKVEPEEFKFIYDETIEKKDIRLDFISPFRYKKQGKYTSNININDVMLSAKRRIDVLSSIYGDGSISPKMDFTKKFIEKNKLTWEDNSRFSRRQETTMKIGGIVGSMQVSGDFYRSDILLLKAANIFNIGKNVSFGLGYVNFEEI